MTPEPEVRALPEFGQPPRHILDMLRTAEKHAKESGAHSDYAEVCHNAALMIERLVQENERLRQEWEDMRGTAMTAEYERSEAVQERDRAVAAAGVQRAFCKWLHDHEWALDSDVRAELGVALADTTGEKAAAVISAAKVARVFMVHGAAPAPGVVEGTVWLYLDRLIEAVDVLDNSRPPETTK